MTNIWFTSDTHFGHTNMVKGVSRWENKDACRPFKSLEEHNEKLVSNINKVVKHNDILYHLGDWSFGGVDNIVKFRNQLNISTIHLIYGNHDIHIQKEIEYKKLFTSCQTYLEKKIGDKNFVMFHYPIWSWHKKKDNEQSSIHLYGHVHNSLPKYNDFSIEVGVDCHKGFRPFSLEEIDNIIKNRIYARTQ